MITSEKLSNMADDIRYSELRFRQDVRSLSDAARRFNPQGRPVSLPNGLRELAATAATLATVLLIGRLVLRLRL